MSERTFDLEANRWYACEIIGDEFRGDKCSYTPILVRSARWLDDSGRTMQLDFCHANYPEGVREKSYRLRVLEQQRTFLLARSLEHEPARILQIYEIDAFWLERHFAPADMEEEDVQAWLHRHAED